MHAAVGDRIVVHSRKVGDAERRGEIVETHGPDGTPPFVVRWDTDGHQGLLFPGPDVDVQPAAGRPA